MITDLFQWQLGDVHRERYRPTLISPQIWGFDEHLRQVHNECVSLAEKCHSISIQYATGCNSLV
jgi:hypothetical protein